jgi:hypothetical protein
VTQDVCGFAERVHDRGDVRELLLDRVAIVESSLSPRPRRSTAWTAKRSLSSGSRKRKLKRSTLVP